MSIKILRGKFSHKVFGIQLIYDRYTIQYAFGKFGIFNSQNYKWIPK